jgi:hypothetical protein
VRRKLEEFLRRDPQDPLFVDELHQEGEGRYVGKALGKGGQPYRLEVKTNGRRLTYEAQSEDRHLRGMTSWSEPPWYERHVTAWRWISGVALCVHAVGVLWPMLGVFGLRRRYSLRTETILSVVAAANFAFACFWGYQLVTYWGVA